MNLHGKKVLVSGAASPIGRAVAQAHAAHGAEVLAVDRTDNFAANSEGDENDLDGAVRCQADVTNERGIQAVAERVESLWGRLDGFVHCHGLVDWWDEGELRMAHWEALFRANVIVPYFLARAVLAQLTQSDGASVTFLGSIDGDRGNPALPAYSASKGGLVPLTHVLADDWAPRGIRVNCLATGLIYQHGPTDPAPSNPVTDFERLRTVTPLRRAPGTQEIAAAAAFLTSNASSYMTGAVLTLDGGRCASTPGTSLH